LRFGIRPQAILLAGVPLAFLLLLLAVSVLLIRTTEEARRSNDLVAQSQGVAESVARASRAIQQFARSHASQDLADYATARDSARGELGALHRDVAGDRALGALAAAYSAGVEQNLAIYAAALDALRGPDPSAASRLLAAPSARLAALDLEHGQLAFEQAVQQTYRGAPGAHRARITLLERILFLSVSLGIVLTLAIMLLFGRNIVHRLAILGENARRLAEGAPALRVGGNDEISELDTVYRAMADRIQISTREHLQALEDLERERSMAAQLQETLLPEIPAIEGLQINTAYATPAEGTQIGGDWFDVFTLSDRLVGLSVGDVTGHGLRAVASMGFIRQAIRVVARLDANPASVLERVNRIVCAEQTSMASAFFGVYDRRDGTLRYSLAGHGPPLTVAAAGTLDLLDGGGMLIGLDPEVRFSVYERALVPGDALVLYTDGIVEAERDYFKGMLELEAAVRGELDDPSDNLAEGIQQRVFSQHPPRDDSALLVLKVAELVRDAGAQPVWYFDARDHRIARRVKRELLDALSELGPAQPDLGAAEIVYGELISNVVRYTPGPARLEFGLEGDSVVIHVDDHGRPFTAGRAVGSIPPPAHNAESGRGLFIISALCSRVAVEPLGRGKRTTVELPVTVAEPGFAHASP
jgi:serine phosphatase RsbU (regulator of sigma subunit)/anti-sigma regulatory factor (Ser/Thr protein kinase)